jgi:hypothetical protein
MELTLDNAVKLLRGMIQQADEDTPFEYRSEHFRDAMNDGIEFLEAYDKEKK